MPSSLQEAMLGDFLRIRWEDSDVGRKAISPDTEVQIVGDSQHMVGDWRVCKTYVGLNKTVNVKIKVIVHLNHKSITTSLNH